MQGEAGTGNVVEAVRHCRSVMGAIRQLQTMDEDEIYVYAKEIRAPVELVRQTKHLGRCVVSADLVWPPCTLQMRSLASQVHCCPAH